MSVFLVACCVVLLLVLILLRLNPMLALLIVSIVTGLVLGMEPATVLKSVQTGVGDTMASLALVLGLGAMFGKIIEISGAARQISDTLTSRFGKKGLPWAMMLTGLIVGIPLFYNAGFVILVPLVFVVARTSQVPLLWVGIPMAASLSVTHGYLPPHPGPTAIAAVFHADIGKTMLYGFVLTIPAVLIAGPLFGHYVGKMKTSMEVSPTIELTNDLPGRWVSFILAILPVALISFATFAGSSLPAIKLFGDPVFALLISLLLACYLLGIRRGLKMKDLMNMLQQSVSGIAMIMMIIATGGAFKQVLIDSGVAREVADAASTADLSPLVLGWLIAAVIRVSIGSATVAGLMAAGIVSSLATAPGVVPELMVLSVGAGSLMCSHVNDTGFWMFKEYFNLTLRQTFLSWTLMETIVSITGLAGVLVLSKILS